MKSASSAEPSAFFESVRIYFNRWAPLAAKLVLPVALSRSAVSSSGVTSCSETVKPIL